LTPRLGEPRVGFSLAFVFRVALLFALINLGQLRYPVFVVFGDEFSWRDVILIGGGLFLIAKATYEIHSEIDVGEHHERRLSSNSNGILLVIVQITLIDLVFSIDSIVTAIGMVQHVEVMIAAVLISMAVMYGASGSVAEFIVRHPTTKMLALSFLILIGVALIADGFDVHIPRGYVYFAMGFAALVETFNILARQRRARHTANECISENRSRTRPRECQFEFQSVRRLSASATSSVVRSTDRKVIITSLTQKA
jgi:predicted tellurium resistance membrane protein TerC